MLSWVTAAFLCGDTSLGIIDCRLWLGFRILHRGPRYLPRALRLESSVGGSSGLAWQWEGLSFLDD